MNILAFINYFYFDVYQVKPCIRQGIIFSILGMALFIFISLPVVDPRGVTHRTRFSETRQLVSDFVGNG
jgi:hypothetical protein